MEGFSDVLDLRGIPAPAVVAILNGMSRHVSSMNGEIEDIEDGAPDNIEDAANDFAIRIAVHLSEAHPQPAASNPKTTTAALNRTTRVQHWRSAMGDKTCPVCLNDFKPNRRVRRLPCGHLFCNVCITQWLVHEHAVCPICRKSCVGCG